MYLSRLEVQHSSGGQDEQCIALVFGLAARENWTVLGAAKAGPIILRDNLWPSMDTTYEASDDQATHFAFTVPK